jgi:hypothetical protein
MHEGKNTGIMIALKKNLLQKAPTGEGTWQRVQSLLYCFLLRVCVLRLSRTSQYT